MAAIDTVLLVLALVCFVLAAVQVTSPKINLVALGLALWMTSALV